MPKIVFPLGSSGGGGSGTFTTISDEGVLLTAQAVSLDIVGAGARATASGDAVTLTIPGAVPGLLAARPAAGAANEGMIWYATDVDLWYISDGATWTTAVIDHGTGLTGLADDDHPQYVLRSILTTKGDLFGRDGSAIVRVPVGTNDFPLVADSSATPGVAYKVLPIAGGGTGSGTAGGALTNFGFSSFFQTLVDDASSSVLKTSTQVGYSTRSYAHTNFR